MTVPAFLLHFFLAACSLSAADITTAPGVSWHVKTSPHFDVMYEAAWSPSAIVLELERMFSTMRLNMAMFAPWMTTEKSRIYIYKSEASYVNGEFSPPRWSKGLAYPAKKTVVVYDTGDITKLKAVLAHELTHLYFEGYFAEKLKYPPQWLNEGLAVYMEDIVFTSGGPWRQALAYFPKERRFPCETFFTANLDKLGSDARISDWYLQAFGTVSYLYRPQTRLQFKNFSSSLRDGMPEEEALWNVYRLRSMQDFSRQWTTWVEGYGQTLTATSSASAFGLKSEGFTFKPVQMSSIPFNSFGFKK